MSTSRLSHLSAAVSAAVLAPVLVVGALTTLAPSAGAATPAVSGRYVPISPTRVLDTRGGPGPFGQGETRSLSLASVITVPASAAVLNVTVTDPTASGFLTVFPTGASRPEASSLNKVPGETRANSVTVAVGQGTVGGRTVQNSVDIFNSAGRSDVIVDVLGYYAASSTATGGSDFFPLAAPVRLFDTRTSIGAMSTTSPRDVMFVKVDYGSPAVNRTISSVVMNMTVTDTGGPGYLTLWNGRGSAPNVSTLNFVGGQVTANMAIVPVVCSDANCDQVTFSVKNGISPATQVIGDITGMYGTPSTQGGLVYSPVTPVRVTDSRNGSPYARVGNNAAGATPMTTMATNTARGMNLNVTAVSPSASTYLSVYPAGMDRPVVSNINATAGAIIPNAVQLNLNSTRTFMTYNAFGSTDVVVDLQGWFVTDSGASASPSANTAHPAAAAAGVTATVGRG